MDRNNETCLGYGSLVRGNAYVGSGMGRLTIKGKRCYCKLFL